ncbi:MAG: regulatory protein RecX [Bilifractor sp.]
MKEWNTSKWDGTISDRNRDTGSSDKQTFSLPEGSRKAAARALKLLLYKARTEKELREKLCQEDYQEAQIEDAIAYCRSFGYLNDEKFAESYISSMKSRKSRSMIRRELEDRGVGSEEIEMAFEEIPFDEDHQLDLLIRKKAGDPHSMDERELRRLYGFLARKGFASSDIWKAIHAFQSEADY